MVRVVGCPGSQTVAEAEEAVGRKLIAGQWWLTTAGAKTTAMPAELALADAVAY